MGATALATMLGMMAWGAEQPASAHSSMSQKEIDAGVKVYQIPQGPVSAALNRFADEAGLRLIYRSRMTERLETRGLNGSYTVTGALGALLSGTKLSYRLSENGRSVSIILAQAGGTRSDATPSVGGARALPPIDIGATRRLAQPAPAASAPTSSGRTGAGTPVDPTKVLGGRITGYNAVAASPSTLKMDMPILRTPMAVQVVTRQTMDDQQVISVRDAVATNVSGVIALPNFFDGLKVRGFSTVGSTYKNGLQEYRLRQLDTTNLQSVEVLKGPAAMLFGRIEPGGIVNLVVKRPLDVPYASVQEQVGSFGLTRTTLDLTGPVTPDKSVLFRFNGEYYRTNSYRDFVNDRNVFLAPTVTWRPIEQFRINVDFEYQSRVWVDDYPVLPAIGNRPASIPVSRYLQEPSISAKYPGHFVKKRIAYDWTYDITPDWSLTNRLSYSNVVTHNNNVFPLGVNQITGVLNRSESFFTGSTDKNFATNIDLKGKFVTGPFHHATLVGFDHFDAFTPIYESYQPNIGAINIYAPQYWRPVNPWVGRRFQQTGQKWTGVYAQDMISFWDDRIHVLLGGRYDWAETSSSKIFSSYFNAIASYTPVYNKGFSPRVGVVYQPLPWLSLYGNFTRSLGANNQTTLGLPLPPQQGEQFEGGVKAEFFDKRLTATAAYYDITKTNIPTPDPTNANNTLLIGKARSQGFEFDLTGRIDDNWSVIANYTHDDVRTVKGSSEPNPLNVFNRQLAVAGSVLPASPRNYGNVWVKYDADGALRGLSLGAGVTAVERSLGDTANSYVLPGYALLNGMIAYNTKVAGLNVTAQLNVKNITDVVYYPSSQDRNTILTGTPRTFLGSLRVEY